MPRDRVIVGHMEELAEGIHDVVKNINVSTRTEVDLTIELIENEVNRSRDCPMDMAETTVFILSSVWTSHSRQSGNDQFIELLKGCQLGKSRSPCF